ncbi:hypothetical protein CJ030_MR1G005063 [Morella rubra]|uniref:Uncharacterized protein n=1 Tax=Morella rubra TaxID=262757 RepID=A0A6A1WSN2_9ROSI|nr:hypothetical protein CJ030_MR1G005063 [Morella rubra]
MLLTMASVSKPAFAAAGGLHYPRCCKIVRQKWRIRASSAAPGVDLKTLESAISKKDSNAVKEALDQLNEIGWAKR